MELVRISHIGRRMRAAFVAVALLLTLAVSKPWVVRESLPGFSSSWTGQLAAALMTQAPTPSIRASDLSSSQCDQAAGWRVLANYSDSGMASVTTVPAIVEYSPVPPIHATIPETTLISSVRVESLGFCAPGNPTAAGARVLSATMWRVGGDAGVSPDWQLAARLVLTPDALGALAYPLDPTDAYWLPGRYVVEARFTGSERDAWMGVVIQTAG